MPSAVVYCLYANQQMPLCNHAATVSLPCAATYCPFAVTLIPLPVAVSPMPSPSLLCWLGGWHNTLVSDSQFNALKYWTIYRHAQTGD